MMSAIPEQGKTTSEELERLRAERDALQTQLDTLGQRRRRTGALRRAAVIVLVVLACLSLTAATVAVWADRTLLNTDGWVETVGPLGADPTVTAALQPRITEAVFTAIPAQELIADALPEDRAFLAAPLSSAVESFVDDQVGAFLASDTFAQLWIDANEVAHERALAVLRGDSDVVQVEGDTVTLNLLPVVNRVLGQLSDAASGLVGQDVTLPTISSGELPEQAVARINAALGIELPPDIGQIEVYNADELVAAQQALRVFDQALVLLVIATPLLLGAAIWLSRNRRRTILQLAVGSRGRYGSVARRAVRAHRDHHRHRTRDRADRAAHRSVPLGGGAATRRRERRPQRVERRRPPDHNLGGTGRRPLEHRASAGPADRRRAGGHRDPAALQRRVGMVPHAHRGARGVGGGAVAPRWRDRRRRAANDPDPAVMKRDGQRCHT
jgi:hypothetical protein